MSESSSTIVASVVNATPRYTRGQFHRGPDPGDERRDNITMLCQPGGCCPPVPGPPALPVTGAGRSHRSAPRVSRPAPGCARIHRSTDLILGDLDFGSRQALPGGISRQRNLHHPQTEAQETQAAATETEKPSGANAEIVQVKATGWPNRRISSRARRRGRQHVRHERTLTATSRCRITPADAGLSGKSRKGA